MRVAVCSRTARALGVCLLALLLGIAPTGTYGGSPLLQNQSSVEPVISDDLLSNSQFVLGPTARLFDATDYLTGHSSPLLPSAPRIEAWCAYASVNPQVVLTLLELDGAQVTGTRPSSQAGKTVGDTVLALAQGFYAHLYEYGERSTSKRGPVPVVKLLDGDTVKVASTVSSATYAVIDALSRTLAPAELERAASPAGTDGFVATWQRLFPGSDPRDAGSPITPSDLPPANLFQFPFPIGQRWWFNGAHNWHGSGVTYGRPYSSMDFFTSADSCAAPPAGDWSVAAAAGTGYHPGGAACWYRIDHGGGWMTSYYHLRNVIGNGPVASDGNLGTIGCETCVGGFATGPHVHFSLLYNGAYVDLDGVSLSDWTVDTGNGDYRTGGLERGEVRLSPYSSVLNEGAASQTPTPTASPTATATPSPASTPTGTPAEPGTQTPTPTTTQTATPDLTGTATATPSAPPVADYIFPQAGGPIRVCPVTLAAEARAPGGVSKVIFRASYGGASRNLGQDANGTNGWQLEWDCQDVPDGAATLMLSAVDAEGQEVITDAATTPVTLSKDCREGTYRTAFFASTALARAPASSWCKASRIDYNWGTSPPGAGVPGADNFSARFRGRFQFEGGTYEFSGRSDDGVRVWIDQALAIDDWHDHESVESYQFARRLEAGLHEIRLDYYESTGPAAITLDWKRAAADRLKTFLPLLIEVPAAR